MTLARQNGSQDWALLETCDAKAALGTHLDPDDDEGALFVTRGTGTLGESNGALDVAPGSAIVKGETVTPGTWSVSIREGDGQPRRDVVYLTIEGKLAVEEGAAAALSWGEHVPENQQTPATSGTPAPPDMADIEGLPIASVLVLANAVSLSTGAIDDCRAPAPVGGVRDGDDLDALGSVATPGGRTNGVYQLPTDMEWGAAINAVDDVLSPGGAVHIPPAVWDCETTGVITTPGVTIAGAGTGQAFGRDHTPLVEKSEDVAAIHLSEANQTLAGLNVIGTGDESSGILCTGERNRIERCYVRSCLHGIHLRVMDVEGEPPGSVNNTVVETCSAGYNAKDGVHLSRDSGTTANMNAIRVELINSRKNGRYGIYQPHYGWANRYVIGNWTRPDHEGAGGIRANSKQTYAGIQYAERGDLDIPVVGIAFEKPSNTGIMWHAPFGLDWAFGGVADGNWLWQFHDGTQPAFMGDIYRLGGATLTAGRVKVGHTLSRVSASGDPQSVPSESFETIEYATIDDDSLDAADIATNSVVVPTDGTYQLLNNVRTPGIAAGSRMIARIDAGGSEVARADSHGSVDGEALTSRVSDIRKLNSGDTVTGLVYHDSGSAVDLRPESAETYLTVARIG